MLLSVISIDTTSFVFTIHSNMNFNPPFSHFPFMANPFSRFITFTPELYTAITKSSLLSFNVLGNHATFS